MSRHADPTWVRGALAFALPAAVFLWLHAPAWAHGFWADDWALLRFARDHGVADIAARTLREPGASGELPYWRPGWELLFDFGYEVFGLRPGPFRALAWAGMLAILAVLTATAHRVLGSAAAAAAAGLLLATCPAALEATDWIAAALNVMPSALLLLLAGLAYAGFVRCGDRSLLAAAAAAFALSFLFREAAYHMPLLVVALHATLGHGRLAARLGHGALWALPFLAAIVVHYLLFNPVSVAGMSPAENASLALGNAETWIGRLFGLPVSPWALAAVAVAVLAALRASTPAGRAALLWWIAAAFPFVARSADSRFLFFGLAPLAFAVTALAVHALGRWRAAAPLLVAALAAAQATQVRPRLAEFAAHAEAAAAFVHTWRAAYADDPERDVVVDFVPPVLHDALAPLLDLTSGHRPQVVNLWLVDRPPLLLCGAHGFFALADDARLLCYDHGTGRYTARSVRERRGALVPAPMFTFAGRWRTVVDAGEVARLLATGAVDLRREALLRGPAPPQLEAGDGDGEVLAAAADTVHRLAFEVDAPGDGFLVLALPVPLPAGATAEVDGAPVPIVRTWLDLDAVPLARGRRQVVVRP